MRSTLPYKITSRTIFVLWVLILFTQNAVALEELEPLENLPPMAGPDTRATGWQWHYIDEKGEPGFMEKIAGNDSVASYERTDGCTWTRSTSGFAPATKWSNCPSTGTSSVDILSDSLWPLKVGNTIEYRIQGTSSLLSKAWSSKRNCKVVKAVKIKTVSGIHDTFKVICEERWGTRTWWLSPVVGTAVAYEQETRRNGYLRQEMTNIVTP